MDLGSQQRRHRSRETFDRRMDQWLETGRQFVDGVSGTRPGRRRAMNLHGQSGSNLSAVSRWVGEKIDWFLEDEDDWQEPWQRDETVISSKFKRPLEAISRRVPIEHKLDSNDNQALDCAEEWPDEATFRVERWERSRASKNLEPEDRTRSNYSNSSHQRSLPRSSRKRFS